MYWVTYIVSTENKIPDQADLVEIKGLKGYSGPQIYPRIRLSQIHTQHLSPAHFPPSIATMPLCNAEGPGHVQISGAHLLGRRAWWFGQPAFNVSDGNNAEAESNVRLTPRGAAAWSARLRSWLRKQHRREERGWKEYSI